MNMTNCIKCFNNSLNISKFNSLKEETLWTCSQTFQQYIWRTWALNLLHVAMFLIHIKTLLSTNCDWILFVALLEKNYDCWGLSDQLKQILVYFFYFLKRKNALWLKLRFGSKVSETATWLGDTTTPHNLITPA